MNGSNDESTSDEADLVAGINPPAAFRKPA